MSDTLIETMTSMATAIRSVAQLDNSYSSIWISPGTDNEIQGSADGELIIANNHQDQIMGGAGNDTLMGSAGDDWLQGEIGDDFLRGDFDEDRVYGGDGDDQAFGGQGNDRLEGDAGNDLLSGDRGNDTLVGGEELDTLMGGEGRDQFVLQVGADTDMITDFQDGVDLFQVQGFIEFEELQITTGLTGQTLIYHPETGQILAEVINVSPSLITEADFVPNNTWYSLDIL